MPTVLPIYTNPRLSFPRSYLSGFVGSTGTSNMHFSGHTLEFDYLFPLYHIALVVNSNVFFANSNVYTVDRVFDFPSSEVRFAGTPIDAGVGVRLVAMTTERAWRIQVLATLSIDEGVRADLPPLANYWRPL